MQYFLTHSGRWRHKRMVPRTASKLEKARIFFSIPCSMVNFSRLKLRVYCSYVAKLLNASPNDRVGLKIIELNRMPKRDLFDILFNCSLDCELIVERCLKKMLFKWPVLFARGEGSNRSSKVLSVGSRLRTTLRRVHNWNRRWFDFIARFDASRRREVDPNYWRERNDTSFAAFQLREHTVRLNAKVTSITHQAVAYETTNGTCDSVLRDVVVITATANSVPTSFSPELPARQLAALRQLNYDSATKIIRFRRRFGEEKGNCGGRSITDLRFSSSGTPRSAPRTGRRRCFWSTSSFCHSHPPMFYSGAKTAKSELNQIRQNNAQWFLLIL